MTKQNEVQSFLASFAFAHQTVIQYLKMSSSETLLNENSLTKATYKSETIKIIYLIQI